jgi:hypothetical protein
MKSTVQKIIPQTDKTRVVVEFYDEEAYYHQSCEVTIFIDNDRALTLPDAQDRAIQAAKAFLARCLG